jgi:hypothetical protein
MKKWFLVTLFILGGGNGFSQELSQVTGVHVSNFQRVTVERIKMDLSATLDLIYQFHSMQIQQPRDIQQEKDQMTKIGKALRRISAQINLDPNFSSPDANEGAMELLMDFAQTLQKLAVPLSLQNEELRNVVIRGLERIISSLRNKYFGDHDGYEAYFKIDKVIIATNKALTPPGPLAKMMDAFKGYFSVSPSSQSENQENSCQGIFL